MAKFKLIVKNDAEESKQPEVQYLLAVEEVFTPAFVEHYTGFDTNYIFLSAGGFDVTTLAQLEKIPQDKLDEYVKRTTPFLSWSDMYSEAAAHLVSPNLSL